MNSNHESNPENNHTLVNLETTSTTYSLKINRRLAHLLCVAFISLPVVADSPFMEKLTTSSLTHVETTPPSVNGGNNQGFP